VVQSIPQALDLRQKVNINQVALAVTRIVVVKMVIPVGAGRVEGRTAGRDLGPPRLLGPLHKAQRIVDDG
jgi:hypothetical protein